MKNQMHATRLLLMILALTVVGAFHSAPELRAMKTAASAATSSPAASIAPSPVQASTPSAPAAPLLPKGILPVSQGSTSFVKNGELEPPAGLRLLVFSPHPDDETIAAGGLIQRTREKGGKVRVVFMTNGDGYKEGVALELKKAAATSSDYVNYGKERQEEAVRAVSQLGLKPRGAVFLGFPDSGIDTLWVSHWSRSTPFTSPFTRFSQARYRSSLSRMLKYDGADLDQEIERVIREFRPDWIVLPDPRDYHPDHATTGVFVLDALRRLGQTGRPGDPRTIQVFTYLVHYWDYPSPSGAWTQKISTTGVKGSPAASRILSNTRWVALPLTAAEQAAKKRALDSYETQREVLGAFLQQFLRPTELFGRLDALQIMAVPLEYAASSKGANSGKSRAF